MKCVPIAAITIFGLFACSTGTSTNKMSQENNAARPAYAFAIHGGAGTIRKTDMTPEQEAQYLKALNAALDIGENVLKNGGSALEAVEKVIVFLEDNTLFNAGKGDFFTNAGTHELDASVMDGSSQKAGAVGGVTNIKNPIRAALAVMNKSPHVMMAGDGA
ncbi:MAG: isoaspartyl peptidase/L-asparaginase, partial [Bacteroidota bacterium]